MSEKIQLHVDLQELSFIFEWLDEEGIEIMPQKPVL